MKHLIINADDFGYSSVFNEKILELLQDEKISSTTVMVEWITENQKNQLEKLKELENNRNVSIGLHLEFKEGEHEPQIEIQLKRFEELFGKKPSHLDIHKSTSFPGSQEAVTEFAKKLGIPCRNWGESLGDVKTTFGECLFATVGSGSVKDFDDIENWLKTLVESKYYEICFHPGTYDSDCKSSLNKDREKDVENIIKLNGILDKYEIQKASYRDLL